MDEDMMRTVNDWCRRHNCLLIRVYSETFAYMTNTGETYIMHVSEM